MISNQVTSLAEIQMLDLVNKALELESKLESQSIEQIKATDFNELVIFKPPFNYIDYCTYSFDRQNFLKYIVLSLLERGVSAGLIHQKFTIPIEKIASWQKYYEVGGVRLLKLCEMEELYTPLLDVNKICFIYQKVIENKGLGFTTISELIRRKYPELPDHIIQKVIRRLEFEYIGNQCTSTFTPLKLDNEVIKQMMELSSEHESMA